MEAKRGDIFYADLSPVVGSEQDGIRPILILQNDLGNKNSPTVIAAPITSQEKHSLPTHVHVPKRTRGLPKNSTVLIEQIRTLDKSRLMYRVIHLDKQTMRLVNKAIALALG